MEWKLLTRDDYVTTNWSGGTTTQLAIAPEGAVYADRDFLWRLSSATVELDHSDFTPLSDYNRWLSVLRGEIQLKIDADAPVPVAPGKVVAFDGGVPVESWGRCVDFNLMVRKGRGEGAVTVLSNTHPQDGTWSPEPGDLAVYCASGSVSLPEFGVAAKTGQTLLCREFEGGPVSLACEAGLVILAAVREV